MAGDLRGSSNDPLRATRDFVALVQRVRILEQAAADAASVPPIPGYYRDRMDTPPADADIGADGTVYLGYTNSIPADVMAPDSRLDIIAVIEAEPASFPWTVQLEFWDGTNVFPLCDVIEFAADPGGVPIVMLVRYSASLIDNGGDLDLRPSSSVQWQAAGTYASGVSVLTDLAVTPVPAAAILNVNLRMVVTGATAGDVARVRTFEIQAFEMPVS